MNPLVFVGGPLAGQTSAVEGDGNVLSVWMRRDGENIFYEAAFLEWDVKLEVPRLDDEDEDDEPLWSSVEAYRREGQRLVHLPDFWHVISEEDGVRIAIQS